MIRRIIQIDEDKCNGCGACANACHEGAIGMVDGKAKLLRDDYCDGLGDCLPECPTGAITFVEREAAAYDEQAVLANKKKKDEMARSVSCTSRLAQWPCQIKLVPVNAPYFDGANILIAADCTAYAYANVHEEFMRGKITLIGCPKLDSVDYSGKLTQIFANNDISYEKYDTIEEEKRICLFDRIELPLFIVKSTYSEYVSEPENTDEKTAYVLAKKEILHCFITKSLRGF